MPSYVKSTSVYLEFQLIKLFFLLEFLYAHESLIDYQIKAQMVGAFTQPGP